jgi:hypothetical protein
VRDIVERYPNGAAIHFWNTRCGDAVDRSTALRYIACGKNDGCTNPQDCIAKINPLLIDRVALVTDGDINQREVALCESKLAALHEKFRKMPEMHCYIIQTGSTAPDASVVAPFIRYGAYKVDVIGLDSPLDTPLSTIAGDSALAVDLSAYTTPEAFITDSDELYATVVAQNMGRGNARLRVALLEAQARWMAMYAKRASSRTPVTLSALIATNLRVATPSDAVDRPSGLSDAVDRPSGLSDAVDPAVAVAALTEMADRFFAEAGGGPAQLNAIINRFLLVCDSVGIYSTALLNTGRGVRARVEDAPDMAALADTVERVIIEDGADDAAYVCPITLDHDTPVLWLAAIDGDGALSSSLRPALLSTVDKADVERATTCPLHALDSAVLVERIAASLQPSTGLAAAARVLDADEDDGGNRNPMTRRDTGTIISLGITEADIKAGNAAIHRWVSDGKVLGSPHLWMVVLWRVITQHPTARYIRDDVPLMRAIEANVVARLQRDSTTYMALSGLPNAPLVKTSLSIAFAYVLASTFIYWKKPSRDAARALVGAPLDTIIAATEQLLGWNANAAGCIRERHGALLVVHWALRTAQNDPGHQRRDRLRRIARAINGQASTILGGGGGHTDRPSGLSGEADRPTPAQAIVLLDGRATRGEYDAACELLPESIRYAGVGTDIIGELLTTVVDENKAFSAHIIPLPSSVARRNPSAYVENYNAQENTEYPARPPVPVCPQTLRPYVAPDGVPWETHAERRNGPLSGQLSLYRYYERFLLDHDHLPSDADEFIAYLAEKQAHRKHAAKDTLPRQIRADIAGVFSAYEAAFEARRAAGLTNTADIVRAVLAASLPRDSRLALERESLHADTAGASTR